MLFQVLPVLKSIIQVAGKRLEKKPKAVPNKMPFIHRKPISVLVCVANYTLNGIKLV